MNARLPERMERAEAIKLLKELVALDNIKTKKNISSINFQPNVNRNVPEFKKL